MPKHKKTIIEYRNYNLSSAFPVLLLAGNRWKISDQKSGRLHFHNCLEIGICHSDGGIMEFENVPVQFREGDITCISKNLPHTTYSNPGTASLWSYIFFDPNELFHNFANNISENMDFSAKSLHSLKYLILNKDSYPKIHFLVSTVIEELTRKPINYQFTVRSLLLCLQIELFRIQETDTKRSTITQDDITRNNITQDTVTGNNNTRDNALVITPALDYIRMNYMQQFTMEYLASTCHFSETHFRRVFHSIMGTSPLTYLNNIRITKACSLLKSTEDSILSISECVGFRSVSSFNRYFQRVIGCSPRDWRYQSLQMETKPGKQAIWEYSGWV